MRKLIVALVALMAAVSAMGALGWYSDYVLVSLNGGADGYYWIGLDPTFGTQFNGANLGSVVQGQMVELGADMRYWSDTADRDGGAYYRTIDGTGFQEVIWTQTYLGGNDYQGLAASSDNVAAGLAVGTHTLTVWAKSWGTGQGDSWLTGVTGENYVATFGITAIPEPTTLVLVGLGVAGLLAYRRRR
ncbi:MAG TPA: PEP-CTERM sorting domain-containing protein [Kiritimatiellia bacterium]|nr:PEP-CTERM sorting domain-containing protein [Kiritimatiellia bacterium]HRZ11794.1 PEP-CTERM sorting domain-containing protein [Kiritimatiellia bacterium]HSA17400.1 PEP-CTERM sorting domain-containing protein [Kiritimatiellia bacterium]